jgi:hypothetical protein
VPRTILELLIDVPLVLIYSIVMSISTSICRTDE